ncbi:MAG TPA: 5-formyltetrahydrofolate cyclo-ligase [Acidiferrobacteraceae bacterium]|nr:5-formyltetrahydrofolate cyclo-ligase [Acidiferrobacteraceae bacterium]
MAPLSERESERQRMRSLRASLTRAARRRAAQAVARRVLHLPGVTRAQHVACYMATGAELDTQWLMRALRGRGIACYLPVLTSWPRRSLRFASAHGRLQRNRLGILEPASRRFRPARCLDLIFAPLLAFDARGGRLGMGGGYYDRSLRRLSAPQRWRRPRLVGLAYEIQQLPSVPLQPWDVPLQAIVTEAATHRVV